MLSVIVALTFSAFSEHSFFCYTMGEYESLNETLGPYIMSRTTRFSALCIGIVAALLLFAEWGIPMNAKDRELIQAAADNDVASLRRLIDEGASLNSKDARGRTALLTAVAGEHVEAALLLIDAGSDINEQDLILDSPFLLAGANGSLEILKRMLQANPDFSLYNRYGGTALIPACERGHVEAVKLLLETDMDIDHVNHLGWTALLEAIVLSDGGPRHQEIVRALIAAGAKLNIADKDGVTPLQHARREGFSEIANLLQAAGAQ